MRSTCGVHAFAAALASVVVFDAPRPAASQGFLPRSDDSEINAAIFQADLVEALDRSNRTGKDHLLEIEKVMLPIWRALPKNSNGRIQSKLLRHSVRLYFARTSSLVLRGFESYLPAQQNSSQVDDLSREVPASIEKVLAGHQNVRHGFSLEDAVRMITVLEELVSRSEAARLVDCYRDLRRWHGLPPDYFRHDELRLMMQAFVAHMLAPNRAPTVALRKMVGVPRWKSIMAYIDEHIASFKFLRCHGRPAWTRRGGGEEGVGVGNANALTGLFSFADAEEVALGISRSFAAFWEPDCASMRDTLTHLDGGHTGRVPLSTFYGRFMNNGDVGFKESETYLEEIGALDQTSPRLGKQVIITNYMYGLSNCMGSSTHHHVCCVNHCEPLLSEIEAAIGVPAAPQDLISSVVGNLTGLASFDVGTEDLDDEWLPDLKGPLQTQLAAIATVHGGRVPLHGRLFAQWLHYAFPHKCPFPAKPTVQRNFTKHNEENFATVQEMKSHILSSANAEAPLANEGEEDGSMSQWSPDEALLSDYTTDFSRGPSMSSAFLSCAGCLLCLGVLAGFVSTGRTTPGPASCGLSPIRVSFQQQSSAKHTV